jgi:hypothetical protein
MAAGINLCPTVGDDAYRNLLLEMGLSVLLRMIRESSLQFWCAEVYAAVGTSPQPYNRLYCLLKKMN